MGQSTSRPERRRVVARLIGVGSPDAEAVAPCVHEPRVASPDGVCVEPEASEGGRTEVGQEDVGRRKELFQHGASLLALEVEGDGPLPAVGQRQRQVDPAAVGPDPLRGQSTVRVALGPFDADDVGTPVGEQCAGDRHEDPLRQLDDSHPVECSLVHHLLTSTGGDSRAGVLPRPRSRWDHTCALPDIRLTFYQRPSV